MSSFWTRLIQLGFKTYGEYLAGDHWKAFKQRYRIAKRPSRCVVCSKIPVQLHHITYEHMGAESFGDVIPLCRHHHACVHDILRARNWPVENTNLAVELLKPKKAPAVAARKPLTVEEIQKNRAKACRDLLAKGVRHPNIPPGWNPDNPGDNLKRYLKLLRRASRRPPPKPKPPRAMTKAERRMLGTAEASLKRHMKAQNAAAAKARLKAEDAKWAMTQRG